MMRSIRLIACGLLVAGSAMLAVDRPRRSSRRPRSTASSIRSQPSSCAATIARADAEGAALIVFTLRTPGGLLDSTRDINNAIIAAKTPVAVFVGPSGNRAASAGFLITIAADIAAMAPGTHIGAAHPVAGNGEKIDEMMAKKMASDTAAYARTLATQRGRNVALVEQAVHREPLVHRAGSARRLAAAHRPRRHRRPGPAPEAGWPDDHAVRRRHDDADAGQRRPSASSR